MSEELVSARMGNYAWFVELASCVHNMVKHVDCDRESQHPYFNPFLT